MFYHVVKTSDLSIPGLNVLQISPDGNVTIVMVPDERFSSSRVGSTNIILLKWEITNMDIVIVGIEHSEVKEQFN